MRPSTFPSAVLALFLPAAAIADITNIVTVNVGSSFSFDAGTAAGPGDITLSSSAMNAVGKAKLLNLFTGGASLYNGISTGGTEQAALNAAGTSAIAYSQLVVNEVFCVQTNGGNIAKALITASTSTSITFQFNTFGVNAGPPPPTITGIYNDSSLTPPGFPNSGISPSSLFVIKGANLADPNAPVVNQDSTLGLPTNGLNGATVSISAGGTTFTPGLYHALASEIAGVVPAAVPTGTATFTVTYNGQSSQAQVQVVASAYGFDTYEGFAVATDALTGALITYTNSAQPGETLIFWGSGNGSDPNDSDTTYSSSPHQVSTPVQFYVGNAQVPVANVVFQGNSVYPGVQIYAVTLPNNVMAGCFVPIAAITNGVPSGPASLPIAQNGGTCQDAYTGLSGTQIMTFMGQTTVNTGSILVGQNTSQGTTTDSASATFQHVTGSLFAGGTSLVAPGACAVTQIVLANSGSTAVGLNPGIVAVTPPGGNPIELNNNSAVAGQYFAQLPANSVPANGGTFLVAGGTSGTNSVGSFSVKINIPNPPLVWSNQQASATVARKTGQTYTWTGGAANSYVIMNGTSSANGVSGSYTCIAPVSADSFTVPPYITGSLPAGSGTSTIQNSTGFSSFTAAGLDLGVAYGSVSFSINSVFN